ncbi:MAG: hypothetical protein ACR2PG_15000 [Hyphomicrobiaceae bacterium]
MNKVPGLAIALLFAVGISNAQTATLLNLDPIGHTLVLVVEDVPEEMTLEAQTGLEGLCHESCLAYINDNPTAYTINATDFVVIRDGELFSIEVEPDDDTLPSAQQEIRM